jgi:DNA-binding XRE family transcriptional regulator
MSEVKKQITISDIILDESIYPREKIDQKRVGIFAETKNTARRAFQNNPGLTSSEIGKAIGRSRQAIDSYIADLRAVIQLELDIKIFRMNRLGIPQERVARRLGIPQRTLSDHLAKMPGLANPLNSDLSRGFTVPQVAEKHGWAEPMVWWVAPEAVRG